LASSQASVPTFRPSPQFAVQVLSSPAGTRQFHPCSSVQVALQPSFAFVLASSQASVPAFTPSPQTVWHLLGVPEQTQPVSRLQVVHPSLATAFLSSHSSPFGSTVPSPHPGWQ
jgi:hypothetical protein